ncbi:MAG: indole-3-glycerol phosphate synthase TrpC [Acidimicrobiales bacterium]
MATYLDRILASHRAAAAKDRRDLDELAEAAAACPPARGFAAAIAGSAPGGVAVIAEVKRRSPSAGDLTATLDPAAMGAAYAAGGAACLSVLTDADFFAGSAGDLFAARAASGVPVLRKDFTVGPADVCDARLMGADAVLLIVAALSPTKLEQCLQVAAAVGIDVLVEVHDEAELAVAASLGAAMIGVNQRDLVTFEVDAGRAEALAGAIPPGAVAVAESGIRTPADVGRLAGAGYAAVLVGASLVTAADPAVAVAAMVRGGRGPRGG